MWTRRKQLISSLGPSPVSSVCADILALREVPCVSWTFPVSVMIFWLVFRYIRPQEMLGAREMTRDHYTRLKAFAPFNVLI